MESPVPFNAFFNVVTFPAAHGEDGYGATWGIFMIKIDDTTYRIYIGSPEWESVIDTYTVPAALFDHVMSKTSVDLSVDDPLMNQISIAMNPQYVQKIYLPLDFISKMKSNTSTVIYYLRHVADEDTDVVNIPSLNEMRQMVNDFKRDNEPLM